MSEVTTVDEKPRRTRKCPLCKKQFQILNKKSKQPICDECHRGFSIELPNLKKKYKELSDRRDELEDLCRKYGNDWCNYGKRWPSEKMCREKCHEWNMVIKEQNAAGDKIRRYYEYLEKWHIDDLMELPSRCNHEFEHLSLTSAHGENPINEMRVEYWASVSCLRCGTDNLDLHTREF